MNVTESIVVVVKTSRAMWNILSVDEVAFLPDLSLRAGEHVDGGHLDHGVGEVAEELGGEEPCGLTLDVGPGGRVGEQRGVGVEESPALGHQAVLASKLRKLPGSISLSVVLSARLRHLDLRRAR